MAYGFLHTTEFLTQPEPNLTQTRLEPKPNLTQIQQEPNLNPTRTSSTQTQTLCEPYLKLAQTQTGNGFN